MKSIYEYVLENSKEYFEKNPLKWIEKYRVKIKKNIDHDEPWLTLMSLFHLFGDQSELTNQSRVDAFNKLLMNSGINKPQKVRVVEKVLVEYTLPEISLYKKEFYRNLGDDQIHLYPDRSKSLVEKAKKQGSVEGNTNLDVRIDFTNLNDEKCVLFIEAKFLSDIDTKTKYNPVRNQIIRNIDAMIDYTEKESIKLTNAYFCMLTPKVFRTDYYGGSKQTPLSLYNPQYGRFYCHVMDRYKKFENIRLDLPSRSSNNLRGIEDNIGWMTFEDMYAVLESSMSFPEKYIGDVETFFVERNL